jgi:hypothetical protein
MIRPEVRIVETQYEESKEVQISSWERQQLLAKYGYGNSNQFETNFSYEDPNRLSYQQMMEIEDRRHHLEQQRKYQEMMNRPKTYSIDGDRVRYNETRWSNIDLGGESFGIEVSVVSDMKFK